jgi:hypothetical protein
MSNLDLTEAVDAAARAASFTRRALIPTAWDDLSERVKLGWREDVLPLITAAAPFIAAQAWDEGFTRGWNAAQVQFNTDPEREVDASEVDVPNPYPRGE